MFFYEMKTNWFVFIFHIYYECNVSIGLGLLSHKQPIREIYLGTKIAAFDIDYVHSE